MVERDKVRICVYTRGSFDASSSCGGWAGVFMVDGEVCYELAWRFVNTKVNRMEMWAAIHALRFWRSSGLVYKRIWLYTDSRYVLDGVERWANTWGKSDWKTSSAVKNKDLWTELIRLSRQCLTSWDHVRGHSGDVGNDRADSLAGAYRSGFKLELKQDLDLLHRVLADRVAV